MTRAEGDPRLVGWLGVVFFLSGAASLAYQVIWQRLLTVHYGVGALSTTLVVCVFMVGLGAGALLGGWLSERTRAPLRAYCLIELAQGLFGLASLPLLDRLGRVTADLDLGGAALAMGAFLLLPTLLMGMTLPLLTQVFHRHLRDLLGAVGRLYFLNTLGAAAGALITGYPLISLLGLDGSLGVAAATNLLLAGGVFALREHEAPAPEKLATRADAPAPPRADGLGRWAFVLAALSGFLALGYEIAWFRVCGVLVKASPYAFASILAVFLLGIALGSRRVARALEEQPQLDRRSLFFLLQGGIGLYVLLSSAAFTWLAGHGLGDVVAASFAAPLHPPAELPGGDSAGAVFLALFRAVDVFVWPALWVFVPTLAMGASFPLLASLAPRRPGGEGRAVGALYAWNLLGNLLGGACTGLFLLPGLSCERTLGAFALCGLGLGLLARHWGARPISRVRRGVCLGAVLVLAAVCFPAPHQLMRSLHPPAPAEGELEFREGLHGVIAAYRRNGHLLLYLNGLIHGIRPGPDYCAQTVEALGHGPPPRRVLVIGYGGGSVLETVLRCEGLERVTLVELDGALLELLGRREPHRAMLSDARVERVVADGRRFLRRGSARYDLVLIDPLRSTTSGSTNLYSREFFQLVASRLNPAGVFLVWLDEHRVIPGTLAQVFPHVRQYAFFALASPAALVPDPARRERVLARFPPDLRAGAARGASLYEGDGDRARARAAGWPLNEDARPVAEYYLGLRLRSWWRGE